MECRHSSSEEGGSQGLIQRFGGNLRKERASLVAQLLKNLPEMWVTWVQFLVWEDPLEKGKVPTSVFWPGEFCGLDSPWGLKDLDTVTLTTTALCLERGGAVLCIAGC